MENIERFRLENLYGYSLYFPEKMIAEYLEKAGESYQSLINSQLKN
ncbi:hypothetical protein J7K28_02320 [Candidatus Aerophobetes bacterium]|nr:hypothetical protein [Candidatus Aerophobetes bacterium]